jgi:uncharacterized protein (TIGR03435 family)
MRHAAIALLLLVGQQASPPAFDVASVKSNKSGDIAINLSQFGQGQYRVANIPLLTIIGQAFGRASWDEIVGGPEWIKTDRWDIVARSESADAPVFPKVRTLLEQRFKLVTHLEMRTMPIYALVDGPGKRRVQPTTADCGSARPSPCTFRTGAGLLTGRGVPMAIIVNMLAAAVQRPVDNRTDLQGRYDVDLHWAVDVPSTGDAPPVGSDAPSIFTVVQEQLGLKLESTRGPVEVLVIDRVERPTED